MNADITIEEEVRNDLFVGRIKFKDANINYICIHRKCIYNILLCRYLKLSKYAHDGFLNALYCKNFFEKIWPYKK